MFTYVWAVIDKLTGYILAFQFIKIDVFLVVDTIKMKGQIQKNLSVQTSFNCQLSSVNFHQSNGIKIKLIKTKYLVVLHEPIAKKG